MPQPYTKVRNNVMSIDALILNLENWVDDEQARYSWADRFVCGFPLPSWQRGFVWTVAQQQRFLLSIWQESDLGSYLINSWDMGDDGNFIPYSNILLDGQQRLTTLERYVKNEIAVPDAGGTPRLWADLDRVTQRRFGRVTFTRCEVTLWDEALLRQIYDLRNFSGTAHLQSERASK
jgi:hypothetical protein